MKAMTCAQLGGACDKKLRANTFEELARLSQQHGEEMLQKQDAQHLEAMKKMQLLMKEPAKMQEWFESRQAEFDALPED